MSRTMLELNNTSIGFKQTLFENISASLSSGSLTCLMGINGAGKSCLLKTVAGLVERKKGEIKIDGRDIKEISSNVFARLVGIVLTEKLQVEYLTTKELVSFGRAPYTDRSGRLQKEDLEAIEQAMSQTGILNIKDKFFSELSDGQKQKVLIARALAQEPELLILDEPTTYLDIPSKIDLVNLLLKLARENNLAVLMSTHDLELIQKNADKIWLMGTDGKFSSGSPEELMSSGLFAKNFFRAELK